MTDLVEQIHGFWFGDLTPKQWYVQDDEIDDTIRSRFLTAWQAERAGNAPDWGISARAIVARLILLDQFPRNMFRGHADSFATDRLARKIAKSALARGVLGLCKRVEEQQFILMPLEHSESIADQHRAVRLFQKVLKDAELLIHARAHREIIRRYGRFPFRNEALGRRSTAAEAAFLAQGGYASMVKELR